jgi:hypothetical protein
MDESLDVARQLVYAYADALEGADSEAYAVEQLEDFIDDTGDYTDSAVLVELLDLPLDETTLSLLNEVGTKLRRRGPAVVESLLVAAVGDGPPDLSVADVLSVAGAVGALLEAATRYPHTPRVENALAVLKGMDQNDLILGLIEVLEGRADERVKQAANDTLMEIGEPALDELRMSRRDRDADPWVIDALDDLEARLAGEPGDDWDQPADDVSVGETYDDEAHDDEDSAGADGDDEAATEGVPGAESTRAADRTADEAPAHAGDAGPAEAPGIPDATPPDEVPGVPGEGRIDEDYRAFLERFKRETGQR